MADYTSFDETGTSSIPNKVFTIVLDGALPANLVGTTDSNFYTHYSALSTVEANLNLHTRIDARRCRRSRPRGVGTSSNGGDGETILSSSVVGRWEVVSYRECLEHGCEDGGGNGRGDEGDEQWCILAFSIPKGSRTIVDDEGNSDPPLSPSPLDADTLVRTKGRHSSLPTIPNANSNFNTFSSSSSSSSRKPLAFEPLTVVRPRSTSTHITQEIELRSSLSSPVRKQDIAVSSEMEEDSQAVDDDTAPASARVIQPTSPSLREPLIQITPTSPAPNLSSETERDSQSQTDFLTPSALPPISRYDTVPCPPVPSLRSYKYMRVFLPDLCSRVVVGSCRVGDEESLRVRQVRRVNGADDEDGDEGRTMWRRRKSNANARREIQTWMGT
ncbi:hypothetical protein C0995_006363 [Termitomyces sp. Mi166|nr:hypothetical protein C0995_006363 [Termitomyces sp. Mi166\